MIRALRSWPVRLVLGATLGLGAISPAAAQDKPAGQPQPQPQPQPPPDRGDVSVPRGGSGAVIVPADGKPPASSKAALPRPINYVPPRYPAEAEKAGLEATVTLQLDLDKDGKVTKAMVIEGAGHGFDESALEAGQKLEFTPALRADGTATAARILYRYSFTLKKAEPRPGQGPEPAAPAPSLRGQVLTSTGDAAIAGASVSLRGPDGKERVVKTDESGAFVFDDLAPARYRVVVTSPGFDGLAVDEDIVKGESTEVKYRLIVPGTGLEVTVRGARPPREVVRRTLERREIDRIPGTNGDALRAIQNLPGVARIPGGFGFLIVRGSAPQDTQTFVDGTSVPLIYHFGGFSSVIPTELIEKIDFYPGNFSAQYGRVMGGIVDVGLRPPKDDGHYHGLVQADFIDARGLLEGPVPLLKGWTFVAAGRRSYIDVWAGPVLEAAGAGVTQAPVYYDYEFMAFTRPSPSSSLRVTFMGSDDALKILLKEPAPGEPALSGNIGFHTAFERLQVLYRNDVDDKTRISGVAALGRDKIDIGFGPFFGILEIQSLNARLELSRRLTDGVTLHAGADVFSGLYDVSIRFPAPPRPGEPPNQPFSTRTINQQQLDGAYTLPAAYIEAEISPNERSKIVPGLRVDYFNISDDVALSPRVNGRYDIFHGFPRTTAKVGVGVFQQPPQFQEVTPPLGNPKLRPNRAIHYALGAEQDITRQIELSVEGFYKQLDRLVVPLATASGTAVDYNNEGRGYVVGSELLLKYKPDDRFFGWAAYTLSRSARTDHPGQAEHLVPFDQTHILTVLGSYALGHGWEIGARFRLVSGNLVTPIACDPNQSGCRSDRTNALFHAPSGVYTPIPLTEPYSERLPLFHQLDIRVDKRWKFKSWQLSAYLDASNVYNHANAEAIAYNFNYTGRQWVSGLPILPSLGLRADF